MHSGRRSPARRQIICFTQLETLISTNLCEDFGLFSPCAVEKVSASPKRKLRWATQSYVSTDFQCRLTPQRQKRLSLYLQDFRQDIRSRLARRSSLRYLRKEKAADNRNEPFCAHTFHSPPCEGESLRKLLLQEPRSCSLCVSMPAQAFCKQRM